MLRRSSCPSQLYQKLRTLPAKKMPRQVATTQQKKSTFFFRFLPPKKLIFVYVRTCTAKLLLLYLRCSISRPLILIKFSDLILQNSDHADHFSYNHVWCDYVSICRMRSLKNTQKFCFLFTRLVLVRARKKNHRTEFCSILSDLILQIDA